MDTSHPTEIALSRTKTAVLVLLGLALVALGVSLILRAPEAAAKIPFVSATFVRIVGGLSVAFFGFITAFSGWRLLHPTPGLLLDARGLTDHTSAVSAGFVPWADVADLKPGGLIGQEFLYVVLRDPAAFLKSVSPVKRAIMKQNGRIGASPVVLTYAALDASFDEMTALVRAYWEAHRPVHPEHG